MDHIHLFAIVTTVLVFTQITNISAQDQQTWFEEWKQKVDAHRTWCSTNSFCRNQTDLYPLQMEPDAGTSNGRLLTPEEGCGISEVGNARIVGGEMAKFGAYPWMALIGFRQGYDRISFHCGGSLITSRHVLSAGHCFPNGVKFHLTYVRLGEYDLTTPNDGPVQDIEVSRIEVPPGFDVTILFRDIAILTLVRDVTFTNRIRPICLPLNNEFKDKSLVNKNPFTAGWGRLVEEGLLSNVLTDVQIPFIDTATCINIYKRLYPNYVFNDAMICAGSLVGGQSNCHGDSGGPLMMPVLRNNKFPMYQVGVVSYGYGCARPSAPTVYTRVEYFMDWIKERVHQM